MLPGVYRVMKFGGSSVGQAERLSRVLQIIATERAKGPIAVVVSAMGDTTDWLIEAADLAFKGDPDHATRIIERVADLAITNGQKMLAAAEARGVSIHFRPPIETIVHDLIEPLHQLVYAVSLLRERTPQTLDLIMSFGERISATVIAEVLAATGTPATFVDARTWTVTNDRFGNALVDWSGTQTKLTALAATWGDRTPIHTGFLGQTADGRTTTLGRNGSDYTGALLARGLGAESFTIWTDVLGVMTADPGILKDAYPITHLSYMEALELANFGARMFHPRTMIPLIDSGVPLRIRNTMEPEHGGTLVDAKGSEDPSRPTCVTSLEKLAMLDVQWTRLSYEASIAKRVLSALEIAHVTVWMTTQAAHGQAAAVVVHSAQVDRARKAIEEELALEMQRREVEPVKVRAPVTLLTLVAEAMGQTPNVAGRFFAPLGAIGVNVRAIVQGASSRAISCVIDADDTEVAVRTVHSAFNFAHQEVSLLVLGKGTVGGQLLAQIAQQQTKLAHDHWIKLNVVAIADSKRVVFDENGIPLAEYKERFGITPPDTAPPEILPLLERLKRLPVPILVDCTAAGGMEGLYKEAFARGIHVVAANKKPLAIPWIERESLMHAAKVSHRAYHYETTVGASLPVIDTLKNLVRTGDHVLLIEGSFSGTLGYLSNELSSGVALSQAVATAREKGYTEPHPRDDLSGLDVARKALILARELGLSLDLNDVSVEPFLPEELLREDSLDAFFAALKRYDATMAARIEQLRKEGRVLRYLATIGPAETGALDSHPPMSTRHERFSVRVGPVGIDLGHPASRLKGSEAFIAFTTERYHDYPLIVQGAGAGGAVTAAGVLADILKVSQTLRGR
ncbi:MAG: bifunctional aspartate kinase/homoserine dehydrogenase I [Polyangiaceae bacterium]|nr:bifunctional aspartate kinase/homoserine dehydrogenase I [Polyangiaceae bacterium]